MNLKLEIILLLLGGILRILGIGVDIWYFMTQTVNSVLIYYLCGSFIVAPSVIFILLTICLLLRDCCRGNCRNMHFKLGLGLLLAIGGPLGIPLFIYAILLAMNDSNTGDFYIIEGLSRASSLVEAMFQSLPQIGIQFYNNQFNSNWSIIKYCSISVSGLSIVYTCYKLCHALDKIQHYEMASAVIKIEGIDVKTVSERKIENELEIYDISNSHNSH